MKQFQTYPDSIITEILRRLTSNETLVQKFETEFHQYSRRAKKECSIVPVGHYVPVNDIHTLLYKRDKGEVKCMWASHNTPYVLLVIEHGKKFKCIFVNYQYLFDLEGAIELAGNRFNNQIVIIIEARPFV